MAHQSQLWCRLGHARLAIASTQLQHRESRMRHENLLMQGIIPLCIARAGSDCAALPPERAPEQMVYSERATIRERPTVIQLEQFDYVATAAHRMHSPEAVAL
jgi:hypothetical protein